jgi:integrase
VIRHTAAERRVMADECAKVAAARVRLVRREDLTVRLWLEGWEAFWPSRRANSTVVRERYLVRPLAGSVYGTLSLREFSRLAAQDWAHKYPAQVELLRRVWRTAVNCGLIEDNVWVGVEVRKRAACPRRPPTTGQLQEIVDRARSMGGWDERVFAPMILVTAYTGARSGGVCGLTRGQVDVERRRVVLEEKGSKRRTVVLCGPGVDAMRKVIRVRYPFSSRAVGRMGYVFRGSRGEQMDSQSVGLAWRAARGDFAGPFHSLKHFAATWLHEQGVSDLDIAVQLGHTDAMGRPNPELVQKRYRHYDTAAALERIERLAA